MQSTMRRAVGFPVLCLLLSLHAAGCLARNNDHFWAIRQRKNGKPAFIYHHSQDIEKSLDIAPQKIHKYNYHSSSEAQIGKHHQIVNSAFPKPAYDPSLNLLAMAGQDLEVENRPVPAANVIVVPQNEPPLTIIWSFDSFIEISLQMLHKYLKGSFGYRFEKPKYPHTLQLFTPSYSHTRTLSMVLLEPSIFLQRTEYSKAIDRVTIDAVVKRAISGTGNYQSSSTGLVTYQLAYLGQIT
ncbi:hypothetical protein MG293_003016 [Ovis ammon polii]|uniref:Protein-tyrosine-phosphatase n=1 Tax=Ovis ammon polii TaxID=230172 RepID=A0AAD4YH22_OVIAM|nr:hypothetical protein MG293_003016 [Ovis ammon polii]